MTHLCAYLGCICGQKTFEITWGDVAIVKPMDGPTLGLPVGIGTLKIDLLPQTKSSHPATADVIMAYRTALGRNWAFGRIGYRLYCPPVICAQICPSLPMLLASAQDTESQYEWNCTSSCWLRY
jgi:hypothetical protein